MLRRTLALYVVIFVINESAAIAQTGWKSSEIVLATSALRSRDCKGAWDLVWPLAKRGNKEARYFLWVAINDRLLPPGHADRSKFISDVLTLASYASVVPEGPNPFGGAADHKWARREIPNAIRSLGVGSNGKRVAQCYEKGSTFQSCLDLSISLGVIKKFDDYANSIEADEQASGLSARCNPPPM